MLTYFSAMQKAIGHNNAPHPELEAELQEETAKIELKVAQGTVTKSEADHLHSLEARAHGRTEKGGITAMAQSIVAKRERQLSLSGGTSRGGRSRTNSRSSTLTSNKQSSDDQDASSSDNEVIVGSDVIPGISAGDKVDAQAGKPGAQAHAEKAIFVSTPRPLAHRKRNESLSDRSNVSPRASEADYERRKEQSQNASGAKGSLAAEAMANTHMRENSQPLN